jgi:hypothetical protein
VIGDDGTTTFVHHLGTTTLRHYYYVKRLTFSGDEDGDGVSNIDEFRQGTDINHPPTPTPTPSPSPTPTATVTPTPTATPTPTPVASPTVPCGVFSLLPAGDPPSGSTLTNPNIDGVSVRYHWSDLEATKGDYNFVGGLDDLIQACADAGKMVCLRAGTGGGDALDTASGSSPGNKPHWLIEEIRNSGNPDDQFFQFVDGSDGTATIPVFWSPTLIAERTRLIQTLGARYSNWPLLPDGTPAVKIFVVASANASSEDWKIPDSKSVDGLPPADSTEKSRWLSAGFTSQKIINSACPASPGESGVIDVAMAAFPNQFIVMAFNPGGWNIDNPNHQTDQQWMPAQIIANARAKYGNRFIPMKNDLNAKQGTQFPAGKMFDLLWANQPCGVQDQWRVSNDNTFRMNSGVSDNLHTIYGKASDTCIAIGAKFRETYEADVKFDWTQVANADGSTPGRDEIKFLHDQLSATCAAGSGGTLTPTPSPP